MNSNNTILFIFPDISHFSLHTGYFHYGLASISAYLKNNTKCDIQLFHIKHNIDEISFLTKIREVSPIIAAFTATTNSFPLVKKYAGWIKKNNEDILTVCGGVHATICPEEVLNNPEIDVLIRGDGEYPMLALTTDWLASRKICEHAGVWHKKNGSVVDGGCSIVKELEELPDPDWGLFDYLSLSSAKQGQGGFMMSRGCPYRCSYCCNIVLQKIYKTAGGNYIRFKSPQRAISEIKSFLKKYPTIHTLYFDDDILPLYKKWFYEFTDLYRKEISKPYWCNIRPNLINEDIAKALADSGCVRVGIGIESGNEKIRNEILKRDLSDRDLISAVGYLRSYDLPTYGYNMLGIPHETKRELLDTIRMNGRLGINKIQATIFYPYPKTALFKLCNDEKLTEKSKWLTEYLRNTILKFSMAQKNRIFFTELMINPICKIYFKLPRRMAEFMIKIIYSQLSSLIFMPLANLTVRAILRSNNLSNIIRLAYRKVVTPEFRGVVSK
jgi:radical SAM superfamily enzyme YgiQ (UPF0313 family)